MEKETIKNILNDLDNLMSNMQIYIEYLKSKPKSQKRKSSIKEVKNLLQLYNIFI